MGRTAGAKNKSTLAKELDINIDESYIQGKEVFYSEQAKLRASPSEFSKGVDIVDHRNGFGIVLSPHACSVCGGDHEKLCNFGPYINRDYGDNADDAILNNKDYCQKHFNEKDNEYRR